MACSLLKHNVYFLLSFFVFLSLGATETGSLIITYRTTQENSEIDRIRFWLINEKNERTLYPTAIDKKEIPHKINERTIVISQLDPGTYQIKFILPLVSPPFEEVPIKEVVLPPKEIIKIDQLFNHHSPSVKSEEFVLVPGGTTIVGNLFNDSTQNIDPTHKMEIPPFWIAKYEVTNAQYAEWLNKAFSEKKLSLIVDQRGNVLDKDKRLLCKTTATDSLSQITTKIKEGVPFFEPLLGKENYPVILVSWHGANAFCEDKGYLIPTESQWEKAAGTSISSEKTPLKRFIYGFGEDSIDPTWANYRSEDTPFHTNTVLTTPVGFYNGIHVLQDSTSLTTHNAKSPAGAYDMSGNVWEWVISDQLTSVVKGGCYDSLAQGVRVAERLPLPPEHLDIYTGFRPVKSK